MMYDDCSKLDVSTLLEKGFQESISAQIAAKTYATVLHHPLHGLFNSALEILETLSEDDVEIGVSNPSSTEATMRNITTSILINNDFEPEDFETLVRMLLRWASKRDLRTTSRALPRVYEAAVQREPDKQEQDEREQDAQEQDDQESDEQGPEEHKDRNSLLEPFESILGELAAERISDEKITQEEREDMILPAIDWVRYSTTQPNVRQNRLCATGFLLLCNMCDDAFAIEAVRKYRLHEAAIATLKDPAKRKDRAVRTHAAAFLANLCQPVQNRDAILKSNIVCDLFYDAADVESELSIRMMRRLVSGGHATSAAAATDEARNGVPSFKHVVEQLPDQKVLQDEMGKPQGIEGEALGGKSAPKPGEQLTKDIAHIYVDIRRHTPAANALITTPLIWSLINLVLLGLRIRNAFDTSEGVFGLGLALQGDEAAVEPLAVEAIEALTRGKGVDAFKQVMEMGKGENEVAKKVAENAASVLGRLVEVAERKDLSSEVVESLREALSLRLEATLIS
jgi:hypothetical protein